MLVQASAAVVWRYQASSPPFSRKVPVGPSMPMVAMRTMTSAPFSTGCPPPLAGLRSVAVKPGSTALNSHSLEPLGGAGGDLDRLDRRKV